MAAQYPVLSISGPRQAGKTTLAQQVFPHLEYLNFEDAELRSLAALDPKRFLSRYKGGLILDEAQYVPQLFSYIQLEADRRKKSGEFVLTGSQNFLMMENITQSLAGRVAICNLLPLSLEEIRESHYSASIATDFLFRGMYPRLYEVDTDPIFYYPNYVQSYVERDVRQLINVSDLNKFRSFTELCAGRVGQLFNSSSLGNELGIDHKTANRWFSLLETSFIAFYLRPYHRNFNKRITKTPKIYFYDTGLACSLLGIRSKEQLELHPLRGPLFENFIVVEVLKSFYNRGIRPNLYFWRDQTGNEIDMVVDEGGKLYPIEIKSAQTFHADFFKNIRYFNKISGNPEEQGYVVYGGEQSGGTPWGQLVSWRDPLHFVPLT